MTGDTDPDPVMRAQQLRVAVGRETVIAITAAGQALLRDREQAVLSGLMHALNESYSEAELRRLDAAIPLLDRLADRI
ncbi:hypothetical protein [Rugosimonospora africana]|uniref:Uncharacterized protein n=1 Tax=Rugosimonospora africana TaxID=556532 RepID=A0A8J3QR52_9ACTN|nr:hypothetical protein [Rugosimonospora africana]GIH14807.1 hypothetical protein Raf01_29790 [Rugosimonospora africana]